MERTYTKVGQRYTTEDRRPQVEETIDALEWVEMPKDGVIRGVPFSPGHGINAAIGQLQLPKVSAVAWNGALEFRTRGQEGEYPGLYGIECNYTDGRARVFVVDTGTELLPVISDFYPKVREEANTT